jgi:hypothetical protein
MSVLLMIPMSLPWQLAGWQVDLNGAIVYIPASERTMFLTIFSQELLWICSGR